jgi:adenylosuccinate lyase
LIVCLGPPTAAALRQRAGTPAAAPLSGPGGALSRPRIRLERGVVSMAGRLSRRRRWRRPPRFASCRGQSLHALRHPMPPSLLTALSPLDGRYAARVQALRPLLSEFGLMHRRVQVEVEWFIALSDAGFAEFPVLSEAARGLLRGLVARFGEADAQAIKDIERTTNHDVKAVEYWLKQRCAGHAELARSAEFMHFACTSEDINNTSHALMLQAARQEVLLPALDGLATTLRQMAHAHAAVPMLSRTHGQTASPTTVGKEVANVLARLLRAREAIARVPSCWRR